MKNKFFILSFFAVSIYLSSSVLMASASVNQCHKFYGGSLGAPTLLNEIAAQIEVVDPHVKLTTSQILADIKIRTLISKGTASGINAAQVKALINERIERAKIPVIPQPQREPIKPIEPTPVQLTKPKTRKVLIEGQEQINDITNLTRLEANFEEINPSLVYSFMPDRVALFFTFDVNGRLVPTTNPYPFPDNQINEISPGFHDGVIMQVDQGNRQFIVVQKSPHEFKKSTVFVDTLTESMRNESHIVKLTALGNSLVLTSMANGKFRLYSPIADQMTENFARKEWSRDRSESISHVHPFMNGDFIALHRVSNYQGKSNLGMYSDSVIQYWHFDSSTRQYRQAGHIIDSPTTEIMDFKVDGSGNMYVLYQDGEVKTFAINPAQPPPQQKSLIPSFVRKSQVPPPAHDIVQFFQTDSYKPGTAVKSRKLSHTPEGGFAISTFGDGVLFLSKDSQNKLSYTTTFGIQANHFAQYYGFSNGTKIIQNILYASSQRITTEWSKGTLEVEVLDEENP